MLRGESATRPKLNYRLHREDATKKLEIHQNGCRGEPLGRPYLHLKEGEALPRPYTDSICRTYLALLRRRKGRLAGRHINLPRQQDLGLRCRIRRFIRNIPADILNVTQGFRAFPTIVERQLG